MAGMTEALARVDAEFEKFCQTIDRCESTAGSDWRDGYNGLARVLDRYDHEKPHLGSAIRALDKVFDNDRFIEGMLTLRQIGEHVTQRKRTAPVQITIHGNHPIDLDCQTSGMAAFGGQEVTLYDTDGQPHQINHLQRLRLAETRIRRALEKARSSIAG